MAAQNLAAGIARIPGTASGEISVGRRVLTVGSIHGSAVSAPSPEAPPEMRALADPPALGPRPIRRFVGHAEDVDAIVRAIADSRPVELVGSRGSGRTAFLRHLAHHGDLSDRFEGVVYLSTRQLTSADALQVLYDAFFARPSTIKVTEPDARRALARQRALVLLDDVDWTREAVEDIVDTLPQCALVIATSERKLWDDVHVVAVATPLDTAVELLERELGRALPPDDRVTARALCAAVDGHAATVRQLGAWLRETRRPLTELAGTSKPADTTRGGWRVVHDAKGAAIDRARLEMRAYEGLGADDRVVLRTLGLLDGLDLPRGWLAAAVGGGLDATALDAALRSLESRRFIDVSQGRASLAGGFASASTVLARTGARSMRADETRAEAQSVDDRLRRHLVEQMEAPGETGAIDVLEALVVLASRAMADERWSLVVEAAQVAADRLALAGRWGTWEIALERLRSGAEALGWVEIAARAANDLGCRALCLNQMPTARARLAEAIATRQHVNDAAGVEAARANLVALDGDAVAGDGRVHRHQTFSSTPRARTPRRRAGLARTPRTRLRGELDPSDVLLPRLGSPGTAGQTDDADDAGGFASDAAVHAVANTLPGDTVEASSADVVASPSVETNGLGLSAPTASEATVPAEDTVCVGDATRSADTEEPSSAQTTCEQPAVLPAPAAREEAADALALDSPPPKTEVAASLPPEVDQQRLEQAGETLIIGATAPATAMKHVEVTPTAAAVDETPAAADVAPDEHAAPTLILSIHEIQQALRKGAARAATTLPPNGSAEAPASDPAAAPASDPAVTDGLVGAAAAIAESMRASVTRVEDAGIVSRAADGLEDRAEQRPATSGTRAETVPALPAPVVPAVALATPVSSTKPWTKVIARPSASTPPASPGAEVPLPTASASPAAASDAPVSAPKVSSETTSSTPESPASAPGSLVSAPGSPASAAGSPASAVVSPVGAPRSAAAAAGAPAGATGAPAGAIPSPTATTAIPVPAPLPSATALPKVSSRGQAQQAAAPSVAAPDVKSAARPPSRAASVPVDAHTLERRLAEWPADALDEDEDDGQAEADGAPVDLTLADRSMSLAAPPSRPAGSKVRYALAALGLLAVAGGVWWWLMPRSAHGQVVTARILAFAPLQASIPAGGQVELCFEMIGASAATIDQGVGPVRLAEAGCVTVAPSATTRYTLTATGVDGETASAEANVVVEDASSRSGVRAVPAAVSNTILTREVVSAPEPAAPVSPDPEPSPAAAASSGSAQGAPVASLQASPTVLRFGTIKAAADVTSRSLRLTNNGNAAVLVAEVAIEGTFADDFSIVRDTCHGASLGPKQRCQIDVRFSPSGDGRRTALLVVGHESLETPATPGASKVTIALDGSGAMAEGTSDARVEPAALSFGRGGLDATSDAVRTVRVVNTGTHDLSITSVVVEGPNAQDFSVPANGCLGAAVAAGQACTLVVRVRPGRGGHREARLLIWSNAPSGPHRVDLTASTVAGPTRGPATGAA